MGYGKYGMNWLIVMALNASAPSAIATGTATPGSSTAVPTGSSTSGAVAPASTTDVLANPSSNRDLSSTAVIGTSTSANGSYSLAPPLPATTLGLGVAHGATKLDPDGTPTAPGSTTTTLSSAATSISPDEKHFASETTHAHERTNSAASMTAIAHGREGKPLDRGLAAKESKIAPSPLAESTVPEGKSVGNDKETIAGAGAGAPARATAAGAATIGQKSTTLGTSHMTSFTPGKEEEGVGHPATHNTPGTSREPGTYPAPSYGTSTKAPATTGVAGSKIGQHNVEGPNEPVDGTGTAGEADALISHDDSAKHSSAPKPVKDKVTDSPNKTYPSDNRKLLDVPDNKTTGEDITKTTKSPAAPGVKSTTETPKTERPTTPTKRTETGPTTPAKGDTEAVDKKPTATTAGTDAASTGGPGATGAGTSSTAAPTHKAQPSTDNPVSPTTSTGSGTTPKKKTGFMKKLKNKLAQI